MLMLDPFYRTIDGFQVSLSRRTDAPGTSISTALEDRFEVISDFSRWYFLKVQYIGSCLLALRMRSLIHCEENDLVF